MANDGLSQIVTARLLSDNPLKVGANTYGQPMTALDGFMALIRGVMQKFFYKDEAGRKGYLVIEKSRTFDLTNETDRHNWKTLQVHLAAFPEMAKEIQLVDPLSDSKTKLAKTKRRIALGQLLVEREHDGEFLASLYRRLIGPAQGLTTGTMAQALLEKTETDIDLFGTTNWIFESATWQIETLLDRAIERGLLLVDGEFYQKPDRTIFAEGRPKAIYMLGTDVGFRHSIESQLITPINYEQADPGFSVDMSDDLADLASSVAVPIVPLKTNEYGALDEGGESNRLQTELELLVDQLVTSNLAREDADTGRMMLDDVAMDFANRSELIGHLKANPTTLDLFRGLVNA